MLASLANVSSEAAKALFDSTPFRNVKDALVPVLTRRTHFKADAAKLQQKAEFQFWLRALPIQFAAILYALATGATVMGLCKLLGEKPRCFRIAFVV